MQIFTRKIIILIIPIIIFLGCQRKSTHNIDFNADNQSPERVTQNESDSIRNHQSKLDSCKFISKDKMNSLLPILQKWINFYNIDLSRAKFINQEIIYLDKQPDTSDIYYNPYTANQYSTNFKEMFYSPDKRYYIDIGIICKKINGKFYDTGEYDDSQAIYFTDRKLKFNHLLFYFGFSSITEAVFWKNNNEFYLVGLNVDSLSNFFIYEYNIANHTRDYYEIEGSKLYESRFTEFIKKERGIINKYGHTPTPLNNLTIDTFTTFPSEIDGCSCYFSNNSKEFKKQVYIYVNDYGNISFLKINGKLTKFTQTDFKEIDDHTIEVKATSGDYEFMMTVKHLEQSENKTIFQSGVITLTDKKGRKITKSFYGECGC